MRLLFILVGAVVATASFAQTAKLDLGLTEQQVTETIGHTPNKVDMEICGSRRRCKIHHYGNLKVMFQQSPNDRMWRVVGWISISGL
jgi:hypothetical protein